MKAVIRFTDAHKYGDKKWRQATIVVDSEDICDAVSEAVRIGRMSEYAYISTIKRGSKEYQWHGEARDAFPSYGF